ncbi:protein disabled isoform X1 [Diachasmimorpha longicaudata]|uniref:protein disabled isoform X1 n=1 Tax=Diachasmimorpha longicaudata TaxID=58733 RepID=UPI0030B88F49
MQTLRKKNSPCKFKKEPTQFLGEGVSFKAKLIGILEVSEARGDQMCQAALGDLKMAIKAAGEHKQRIAVQVSIDGLRLRDEKTGECLYHHAVHKISFIAQDRYDSRAFGYIFGSPDTGHRFFGIKTDKAANHVVMAMRDLFQVVFELKKKEMELAKQHIEQNVMKYHTSGIFVEPAPDTKGAAGVEACVHRIRPGADAERSLEKKPENRSGVIADLLDLQFELNSLQQGIHQMDKLTPENPRPSSEDPFEADPFGDSFTNMKVKNSVQPILPPPPSSAKRNHLERQATLSTPTLSTSSPATVMPSKTPPPQTSLQWLESETEKRFSDGEISSLTGGMNDKEGKANDSENGSGSSSTAARKSPQIDVFTELDPLGTGLSKPYIDKKDFFQHLKNPPKKVLKELASTSSTDTFPTNFHLSDSLDPLKSRDDKQGDLFEDGDFANFDKFDEPETYSTPKSQSPQMSKKSHLIHHQPLSVCLPPEDSQISKCRDSSVRLERDVSEPIASLIRLPSPKKYQSSIRKKDYDVDLPSACRTQSIDKTFPVDFVHSTESPASPLRSCSSDANSRVSISSAELDIVPEPPPRGAGSILINPPPLPPKKQGVRATSKPPPRPPHNDTHFHYDFIEREESPSTSPVRSHRPARSPDMEMVKGRFDDNFSPPSSKFQSINTSGASFEDSFNSMIPTTLSSLFKTSYLSSSESKKKPSLDITLSQLTSSNLTELATSLEMTVGELTSLTLQQLTECLSQLSAKEQQITPTQPAKEFREVEHNPEIPRTPKTVIPANEPLFTATFDQDIKQPEDPKYDKYAVFRELLDLEQSTNDSSQKDSIDDGINDFDRKESIPQEEMIQETECKIELNIKIDVDEDIPEDIKKSESNELMRESPIDEKADSVKTPEELETKNDSIELEDMKDLDESDEKYQSLENSECEKVQPEAHQSTPEAKEEAIDEAITKIETKSPPPTANDRYAALREIISVIQPINVTEEKSKSPSPVTTSKSLAEHDLMKLFSAPSSHPTSPKKISKEEIDLKATATDIFQEIQMLNSSVNNSTKPSASGFEDVFCPFVEHKKNREESKDDGNWAKFESGVFQSDKSSFEAHGSLGGTSPWSPDDKEIQKELGFKISTQRHSGDSDNEWKDEEESEESNGRARDEGLWRHPPTRFDSSCEESTYYDANDKDRSFRDRSVRKTRGVPWTKTPHRPRLDPSPWHEETRWEDEPRRYPLRKIPYKDEEERKAHWKCRSGQRAPWNGERDPNFRIHDHQFYEEDRGKRRMMLWNEDDRDRERDRDRFSSQESMGYDDEERWSIREYERRRWEEDSRFWRGRTAGETDYPIYRKHNMHYCRDSRERPIDYNPSGWEEDYGPERSDNSPRYVTRKRHWPKRPNSANEDRNAEVVYAEPRMKYGMSRSECSDNDSDLYHRPYRSRSRESYWESDQEFESWGERPYWSEGPDMKSESLHRRRMNRHKQPARSKPQSSPFEDDFTQSIDHGQVDPPIVSENRVRPEPETKQPLSPRNSQEHVRKDGRKQHVRSSFFDDDLTPSASSDASDRQRVGSDLKATPDDAPVDPRDPPSADSFVSEDSGRDSFFNGDPRFDDDAFAFRSEVADSVPNKSTLPLKNSRQIKYGNNRMKGDYDIKKSESVNIFVRESDPFDDDDFFN